MIQRVGREKNNLALSSLLFLPPTAENWRIKITSQRIHTAFTRKKTSGEFSDIFQFQLNSHEELWIFYYRLALNLAFSPFHHLIETSHWYVCCSLHSLVKRPLKRSVENK